MTRFRNLCILLAIYRLAFRHFLARVALPYFPSTLFPGLIFVRKALQDYETFETAPFHGSKDCNWRLNCLHARLYARSSSTLQFNFRWFNKETPFSLLLPLFFFYVENLDR